jgi:DeoR/GlpR family transcriptional regulator of sugar metabolism
MLLIEREQAILDVLNERKAVSVRELANILSVTDMTIRRDLKKMDELGLLRRTHGGAARLDTLRPFPILVDERTSDLLENGLILAPVLSRAAKLMRERAQRSKIPLIAESAELDGAVYVGPQNYEGSYLLGTTFGAHLQSTVAAVPHVLHVTLRQQNTEERGRGFFDGLQSVYTDGLSVVTVDGRGLFNEAYRVALDALRVHSNINVIFGVNDDSVLGALQAYLDLERDPQHLSACNVGGEGKTLLDVLYRGGPLKACLALFPEVVGQKTLESIVHLMAGTPLSSPVITPHAVLTPETLPQFYKRTETGWSLIPDAVAALPQTALPPASRADAEGKRVSFAIHFRTHEWYQNVAAAMQQRADELGIELTVADVNEDVQAEIGELRRLIGKMAANYVSEGDTIILDAGMSTESMAQYLDHFRHLTVITNSLPVFQRLHRHASIKLVLTGGELHREAQALVGRAAQSLLRDIRADKAFIVAGGVTPQYGISCKDDTEAEVRRAMIDAAREVVLLADNTVLGSEANFRIAPLESIHTLITDSGANAQERLMLNQQGIRVLVAGQFQAERG